MGAIARFYFLIKFTKVMRKQSPEPKKIWVFGLGLGLENPNPKTQKTQNPNPNPKYLGFKFFFMRFLIGKIHLRA